MRRRSFLTLILLTLSACARTAASKLSVVPSSTAVEPTIPSALAPTATPTPATSLVATSSESGNCALMAVVAPTMPAKTPVLYELDDVGLHVTGHAQVVDLASYRLKVSGKVDRPLSLTYDELRCMTKVTAELLLVCPGVFSDSSTWSGVPIKNVLERAGVQAGAANVLLTGADDVQFTIPLADALDPDNYLAYEWKGQPLPVFHGFPLRAIFPGVAGGRWVKWIVEITVE